MQKCVHLHGGTFSCILYLASRYIQLHFLCGWICSNFTENVHHPKEGNFLLHAYNHQRGWISSFGSYSNSISLSQEMLWCLLAKWDQQPVIRRGPHNFTDRGRFMWVTTLRTGDRAHFACLIGRMSWSHLWGPETSWDMVGQTEMVPQGRRSRNAGRGSFLGGRGSCISDQAKLGRWVYMRGIISNRFFLGFLIDVDKHDKGRVPVTFVGWQ